MDHKHILTDIVTGDIDMDALQEMIATMVMEEIKTEMQRRTPVDSGHMRAEWQEAYRIFQFYAIPAVSHYGNRTVRSEKANDLCKGHEQTQPEISARNDVDTQRCKRTEERNGVPALYQRNARKFVYRNRN